MDTRPPDDAAWFWGPDGPPPTGRPAAARAKPKSQQQEVLEAMKERAAKLSELEAGRKRGAPVKPAVAPPAPSQFAAVMDVESGEIEAPTANKQLVASCAPTLRLPRCFLRFSKFFLLL